MSVKHRRASKKARELGYRNVLDVEDYGTDLDKKKVKNAYEGISE